jgi:hypothetical protein
MPLSSRRAPLIRTNSTVITARPPDRRPPPASGTESPALDGWDLNAASCASPIASKLSPTKKEQGAGDAPRGHVTASPTATCSGRETMRTRGAWIPKIHGSDQSAKRAPLRARILAYRQSSACSRRLRHAMPRETGGPQGGQSECYPAHIAALSGGGDNKSDQRERWSPDQINDGGRTMAAVASKAELMRRT